MLVLEEELQKMKPRHRRHLLLLRQKERLRHLLHLNRQVLQSPLHPPEALAEEEAAAYYNGFIPDEYLGVLGDKRAKVDGGLKDAVERVTKKVDEDEVAVEVAVAAVAPAAAAAMREERVEEEEKEEEAVAALAAAVEKAVEEDKAATKDASGGKWTGFWTRSGDEIEEKEVSLDHPEGGSRVDIDKISAFYNTVNKGRVKQAEEEARESAARATELNESYETRADDPMSAISTAESAMSELQSTSTLQNSQTLAAANAALRSDLDMEYFKDIDALSESELRIRVVQLVTEMSDRTKWEAVRLKEFLAMKEKEVGEKYLGILQKQRLEFEALLAGKLREQEDGITRQANAALAAKEESIQSLLKATNDAREQEMKDILTSEGKKLNDELALDYQTKLQNELAAMKQQHGKELEGHLATMKSLQEKLETLESRLEVSRTYESGSRKAHRVSAAALALANKLEVGEEAAVELAALKGAVADEEGGVIASAVMMIPPRAKGGVPTVADLQVAFDESYSVGRQVRYDSCSVCH